LSYAPRVRADDSTYAEDARSQESSDLHHNRPRRAPLTSAASPPRFRGRRGACAAGAALRSNRNPTKSPDFRRLSRGKGVGPRILQGCLLRTSSPFGENTARVAIANYVIV